MKERPILMSGPMVRAILAGTKTQTRRVVELPHMNPLGEWQPTRFGGPDGGRLRDGSTIPEQGGIWHTRTGDHLLCHYGQPGDRLWVREAWAAPHALDVHAPSFMPPTTRVHYAASEDRGGLLWRPSIHMPRWASRITLEVTGVLVERLQSITVADCISEGISFSAPLDGYHTEDGRHFHGADPRASYASLWTHLNGPRSWDANPWVWVVHFRRITP